MYNSIRIKDVKREIGDSIKVLRKHKSLTQMDLAQTLEMSTKTIQNLELGKNFTIDTLLKVLKELDVLEEMHRQVTATKNTLQEAKSLY